MCYERAVVVVICADDVVLTFRLLPRRLVVLVSAAV
jgi:hypothetical protein